MILQKYANYAMNIIEYVKSLKGSNVGVKMQKK